MNRLAIFIFIAISVFLPITFAQTVIQPSGNVFVRGGANADNNYYNDPDYLLRVRGVLGDNERKTYLKFDLSGVTGDFSKAELQITVNRAVGTSADWADLFTVSDDSWDETTITWNNAPPRVDFLLEREFLRKTSTDPDTVYTFDITSYVKSELAGDKVVSICMWDTAYRTTDLRFWSNRTLLATGPQLVLKTGPVGSISLTSPVGGETWVAGSTQNITWASSNISDVKIDFSTNNGGGWTTIEASIPNTGSYSWAIPDVSSSHLCKVRVSDANDPSTSDMSDSVFVITNSASSITINTPNGGENWIVGSTQMIQWSTNYISNVKIEYTVDNGNIWNLIGESVSATDNSYLWNVPALPSNLCKIRITDIANPVVSNQSASNFSIVEGSQDNLVAVDQVYVQNGINADSNFVAETLLRVRGDAANVDNQRMTYLKFDLSSRTESIDKAELKLTVYQVPNAGSRSDFFTVENDAWSEASVTWNSAPSRMEYLFSQSFPTKSTSQPDVEYSWDVTSYVKNEFAGDKLVSFCLVDTINNGSDIRFGSDRGFTTGPRLALFVITDVEDEIILHPNEFEVLQNYPNPFNPVTKVTYNLPSSGNVKITVHDILGNSVQELVSEFQQSGVHYATWKANVYPSGVYFCKVQFGTFNKSVKMILVK